MSRYIDAEWLKEHIEVISYEGMWHTTETDEFVAVDNINQAPSIDIVRCKECKHWTNGDDTYGICYRCTNTRQMKCDDFCSRGEREGE